MDVRHYLLLFYLLLAVNNAYGFVKRDITEAPTESILEPFQQNVNRFRECLDQSLAAVASQVNEKQLQPVFNALGDQLNRFTKAFDILTSPKSPTPAK